MNEKIFSQELILMLIFIFKVLKFSHFNDIIFL